MQKLAGFAVVLLIMAVERTTGRLLIESAVAALNTSLAHEVAWVFLLYQLAGSNRVYGVRRTDPRFAPTASLSAQRSPGIVEAGLPDLEDALVEPSFAIELVGREEQRLLQRLPTMLDGVRADAEGEPIPAPVLRAAGTSVTRAMAGYLESINEGSLDRADREHVVRLQHRTSNLNAMQESLEEFVSACLVARQWPSSGHVADQMIESLHALLNALVDAATSDDAADHAMILSLLGHRDEMMERIRQRVLQE